MTSESRDIVARLRKFDEELLNVEPWTCEQTAQEAADEITSLRHACRAMAREIERMKGERDEPKEGLKRLIEIVSAK